MAYCKKCGHQIDDAASHCAYCGAAQSEAGSAPQVVDNGGFGWGFLGCMIPLVGLILFLVWRDTKPKTSKAAGMGALISVIVSVVLYVVLMVLGVAAGVYGA
ncbi:MAG: zinc-ribbon domain-containing protein [Ruminococcaceae bacterium]|nr:zinc-ribbon domain-containing protein [Oscillospiraceae bacterium]